MDYNDLLARDRELELAKIRARQAEREAMRRVYRKRRGIAVAVLAFPIAAFALATAWPSKQTTKAHAAQGATTHAATTAPVTTAAAAERFPEPKEVRGVHLSIESAADPATVDGIIAHANPRTGINAVEVDVKDERGHIGFDEGMPDLAVKVGSAMPVYEPRLVIPRLHDAGLYVIGRIVMFEDPILSVKHPAFAIRTASGGVWKNYHGLGWLNPYDTRVWDYAIALARAAGRMGFDEIQFDYVRFPTDGPYKQAVFRIRRPGTMADTITAFLTKATRVLHQDHLRVSADLFGLAAQADQGIGQDPLALSTVIDVVSPMVYPQGYASGEYGLARPQEHPYKLVLSTLTEWQARLANGTAELRPWLQAYTLAGPHYGPNEVHEQVRAVRDSGQNGGFLLWNAGSRFDAAMLAFTPAP